MTEVSKQIIHSEQCARIILCISEMAGVSIQETADMFYESETANLIEDGVADLHCRSDKYLAILVIEEHQEKESSHIHNA